MIWMIRQVELVFQSTPPARGATPGCRPISSTTAPFQSTPPARGATPYSAVRTSYMPISIHAPREGGDYDTSKKKIRF